MLPESHLEVKEHSVGVHCLPHQRLFHYVHVPLGSVTHGRGGELVKSSLMVVVLLFPIFRTKQTTEEGRRDAQAQNRKSRKAQKFFVSVSSQKLPGKRSVAVGSNRLDEPAAMCCRVQGEKSATVQEAEQKSWLRQRKPSDSAHGRVYGQSQRTEYPRCNSEKQHLRVIITCSTSSARAKHSRFCRQITHP